MEWLLSSNVDADLIFIVGIAVVLLGLIIFRLVQIMKWSKASAYIVKEREGDKFLFYRRLHFDAYEYNPELWGKDSHIISVIIIDFIATLVVSAIVFFSIFSLDLVLPPVIVVLIAFCTSNIIMFLISWKIWLGCYYALILPIKLLFKPY